MNQSLEELANLRHSFSHLLAAAVSALWPDAKPTLGPAIEDGFYYDFEFPENVKISDADFSAIEAKMREIVASWESFHRIEKSAKEAVEYYSNNEYKVELIREFEKKGEKISFYQSGDFVDLCKGGHIDSPRDKMKYFRLMSVAGAYWRGSEKNKMLTRIYGTAFFTQKELDEHLRMLEEAKKRDHRKLGSELELFFIDEMVGKGLIMWLPKGTIVRDQIEKLAREKETAYGYVRVVTPHIAKEELFLTSGHLPYYKDSMYPPMVMDDGTYYLKAMNCPHHHRVYLQKPKSYRDLPVRIAEYGTCYRNELSGVLSGLLRVRCMAMNDAHIYCRKDQIREEFTSVLRMTREYFDMFGLKDYWFRLSKWDPEHTEKYINEPGNWEFSEQVIREVLASERLPFTEVSNEAAFYGPKVDVQFKSTVGREETMSTIQLDFAAKGRFGLSYTDEKGKENDDVFVIHRAPLSVHERFMAFLIEHYAGAFPLWLAPVQLALLPIGEKHIEYARVLQSVLVKHGVRVEVDDDAKSIGAKIRFQTLQKVPYMGIMGDKEMASKTVSLRRRDGSDLGTVGINELTQKFLSEIENRS